MHPKGCIFHKKRQVRHPDEPVQDDKLYHRGIINRFCKKVRGKFGMFRYMSTDGLYKNNEGTSPIADPFPAKI